MKDQPPYQALILDMDGVIIDSEPLHKQVEQEILRELGVNLPHAEHIKFAGVGKEMWTILKEHYGYNRDLSEDELHSMKRDRYLQRLNSSPIRPIDGIVDLVLRAKALGMKVAIASSSSRHNIMLVSGSVGIYQHLDCMVSGDEVAQTKPNPDIFVKASQLLNVSPQHCLVVEDSENGVKAAKAAGMSCIGFVNPNSGNQDLSLSDKLVNKIYTVEHYLTQHI